MRWYWRPRRRRRRSSRPRRHQHGLACGGGGGPRPRHGDFRKNFHVGLLDRRETSRRLRHLFLIEKDGVRFRRDCIRNSSDGCRLQGRRGTLRHLRLLLRVDKGCVRFRRDCLRDSLRNGCCLRRLRNRCPNSSFGTGQRLRPAKLCRSLHPTWINSDVVGRIREPYRLLQRAEGKMTMIPTATIAMHATRNARLPECRS
jgi:hypothetical protein